MNSVHVYERRGLCWCIEIEQSDGIRRPLQYYPPGEAGLPEVQAYLRGYFHTDRFKSRLPN